MLVTIVSSDIAKSLDKVLKIIEDVAFETAGAPDTSTLRRLEKAWTSIMRRSAMRVGNRCRLGYEKAQGFVAS